MSYNVGFVGMGSLEGLEKNSENKIAIKPSLVKDRRSNENGFFLYNN